MALSRVKSALLVTTGDSVGRGRLHRIRSDAVTLVRGTSLPRTAPLPSVRLPGHAGTPRGRAPDPTLAGRAGSSLLHPKQLSRARGGMGLSRGKQEERPVLPCLTV